MPRKEILPPRDLRAVMSAMIAFLRERWPNAVHLTPRDLPGEVTDEMFLEAAFALQDAGVIMYEAMLVGAAAQPSLRDAILTRKGQLEIANFDL